MSVLHLAPPVAFPAPPPRPRHGYPADEPTVTLWHVGKRLGLADWGAERLARHVAQLIRDHGFPRPLPAPCKGKVVGGVHRNSQWVRVAVDHWFDSFIPAEAAAALDEAAQVQAADEMDARASNLRLIK